MHAAARCQPRGEMNQGVIKAEHGDERLAVDTNCVICAPQFSCGFKNNTAQLAEKRGGGKSFYENRVNLTFTGF